MPCWKTSRRARKPGMDAADGQKRWLAVLCCLSRCSIANVRRDPLRASGVCAKRRGTLRRPWDRRWPFRRNPGAPVRAGSRQHDGARASRRFAPPRYPGRIRRWECAAGLSACVATLRWLLTLCRAAYTGPAEGGPFSPMQHRPRGVLAWPQRSAIVVPSTRTFAPIAKLGGAVSVIVRTEPSAMRTSTKYSVLAFTCFST